MNILFMKLLLLCSLHFAKGKNVSHPGLTKDNKFFGATIDKPGAFLIASVLGTNERLISISEQLLQTNQTFQHLTLAKAEEIYDIALYPLSNIGTFYFNWVEKGVIDITQEDFVKLGDRNDPKQCIQFFNKKKRSMSFLFKNKKNIFFIISDEEVGFYLDYNPLIDQKNEIDELVSQLKSSAKALKEHKITYKETLIQLTTIGPTTASGAGNVAGVVLKPPKAIAQKPFESKQRERVPNNTQIQAGSNVDDRKEDLDEEEPRQRESIQETLAQEPINRRIKKIQYFIQAEKHLMTQEQKIFLENKLTRKEENEQLGADLNEGSYYTFDYQDENESAKTYYVFYHCVNGSRNYYAGATDGTYKAILIDEESLQNTSTNYIKIKFKPIEAAAYEIDLSLDDFAQNPLPEEIKPRRVLRDITNLQRAKSRSQMEQKTRQNMDLGSASKSIRDSENYSTPMKKREAQNDVTNRGRRMTFPTPEKENEPNAPSNGFFIENTQNHIAHDELNLGSLYTLINFDEMEKCIAAIKTPEKDSLLKDITNQVIESNRASGINSEIDSTSVKNPKNLNKRRKTFPMPKQDKLFQEISNEQRKERMASLMLYSTPKKNSDKNITKTVHEKLTQAQENADQIISVELRSTKYRFNNESHIYPNIAQLIKKLDRANNNEIDSIIELEIFIQEQGDKLHMVLTNEDWPIFTALYYGNIYFFALDDDVNAISMEIPYKLSEQTYNNEDIIAIKKRIQSRKEDVVWMVQAAHEEMAS